MSVSQFVINQATQPISLSPAVGTAGYAIYKERLYVLYHAQLPWKPKLSPSDDYLHQPLVIGFQADDFMIGEANRDRTIPFMVWAINRARQIMDAKVRGQGWEVNLSPSSEAEYFRMTLIGDGKQSLVVLLPS